MFRWLEVLEKEFDKAFVDVDLLLGEIDPDQADITYEGRQKMTSLSSCFAQLCHKAQTVSQINHKLEVSVGADHMVLGGLITWRTHETHQPNSLVSGGEQVVTDSKQGLYILYTWAHQWALITVGRQCHHL